MLLAHEIAHDVLEHKANVDAIADISDAGVLIGQAMSYAPGVIGLIGAGIGWTASLGGKATVHLYSRSAELEADRLAIDYWKRLGWNCSYWAYVLKGMTERGIEDFHHPGAVRTKQAAERCLPSHELQYFLGKLQALEQKEEENQFVETSEVASNNNKGLDAYNRGDYETALRILEPLAEQGFAIAQYNLGMAYYRTEDYVTSVKWLKLAAEQGFEEARKT